MKKTKRVFKLLYITREEYPTFRVDLTQLFSQEIVSKGHSIDWYMRSESVGEEREEMISKNERVFVGEKREKTGLFSKIKNNISSLFYDLKIVKKIRKNKYDFVQVRDKVFAGLVAAYICKKEGIPFYYWMSFPYPEADLFKATDQSMNFSLTKRVFFILRGRLSSFILYRFVLPKADFIFVQSDRMLQDVLKHRIPKEKMMPIPMGISLDRLEKYSPVLIQDERLMGKDILVYLGTMVRVRRIDFLLDVLLKVLERRPNVILLLVGDAPAKDMEFLKERAIELGIIDHVVFTGFVPMVKGWSYIKGSNICLSPFRPSPILDSTSPTKIVEYLALGKPVVANKHPDQSKVLLGSGAGYAVEYSPEAFADACLKILESNALSFEMGQKGVAYVKSHRTYKVLGERLESQYQKLLENR